MRKFSNIAFRNEKNEEIKYVKLQGFQSLTKTFHLSSGNLFSSPIKKELLRWVKFVESVKMPQTHAQCMTTKHYDEMRQAHIRAHI